MESQRPPKTDNPMPSRRDDWAYEGTAGQTRAEPVHVMMADGTVASVLAERAVNVATHPELRQRVLKGDLHRLDDGRNLKLPFVFHDPKARKFALVVPTELSHLELQERAKLMEQLAADTAHPVPMYVRNCTTVVGIEALEAFLDAPASAGEVRFSVLPPYERMEELKRRTEALAQREFGLAEQERNLISILEGINKREKELSETQRQLEGMQNRLAEREELLEQRLAELERTPPVEDRVYATTAGDGEWQEVGSQRPEPPPLRPAAQVVAIDGGASGGADSAGEVVEDGEVEELEPVVAIPAGGSVSARGRAGMGKPPPLRLRNGAAPPPLRPRVAQGPDYPGPDGGRVLGLAATRPSGGAVPPLPIRRKHAWAEEVPERAEVLAVPSPDVEPPEHFFSAEQIQMAVVMDEEPWLFVRVDDVHAEIIGTQSDLLVQYLEVEGYPTVFLTLVIGHDDEPYVRRLVLDPYAEGDREVLEALGQSFQASVACYIGDYYQGTIQVSALRESVVHAILERTAESVEDSGLFGEEALEEAIVQPPPVRAENLPFGPARRRTASLTTAADATEQLAFWMEPDKLDEAQFTYSVPQHVIEASAKRVLGCAIRFGVALPDHLVDRALDYGLAEDRADLVRHQLSAFASLLEKPANDFGPEAIQANWRRLLKLAEACEVAVDDKVMQLAEEAERLTRRDPGEAGDEEPADIASDKAGAGKAGVSEADSKESRAARGKTEEAARATTRKAQKADSGEASAGESAAAAPAAEEEAGGEPGAEAQDSDKTAEESLAALSIDDLLARVRRSNMRVEAAMELCKREDQSVLTDLFRAMEDMESDHIARVVSGLLRFGESAGEVLLAELESDSEAIRHAVALALGELRLHNAIEPLIERIQADKSDAWRATARALGKFGTPALRHVTRALKETAGNEERYALVLAHLASHGCAAEVDRLGKNPNKRIASTAKQAIGQRSALESENAAMRRNKPPKDETPSQRLTRVFFQGVADK